MIVTGRLERGEPLPGALWLIVFGYIVIPLALGFLVGTAARKRWAIARPFLGPQPHPRGWDALFTVPELGGYLKLQLKDESLSNRWIMGAWASEPPGNGSKLPGSYAAGYPHDQDLFLHETYLINPDGTPDEHPPDSGIPVPRKVAVLVRWSEVTYAEFIEG